MEMNEAVSMEMAYGKLVVLKKKTEEEVGEFLLESTRCLIGRSADCDIRIELEDVRPYCSLKFQKGKVYSKNLVASTGLVLVNGKNLSRSTVLEHKDVITIVGRSFRFEYLQHLEVVEDSEVEEDDDRDPDFSLSDLEDEDDGSSFNSGNESEVASEIFEIQHIDGKLQGFDNRERMKKRKFQDDDDNDDVDTYNHKHALLDEGVIQRDPKCP